MVVKQERSQTGGTDETQVEIIKTARAKGTMNKAEASQLHKFKNEHMLTKIYMKCSEQDYRRLSHLLQEEKDK